MGSWLTDAYTVDEVVEAYLAMELLLGAPGFTQDEHGMLAATIKHLGGADSASITELRNGVFLTLAASDQAARDADALQCEMESGPCLDAITERTVFAPIDLTSDPRWPDFGLKVANGPNSSDAWPSTTRVSRCGTDIGGAPTDACEYTLALCWATSAGSLVLRNCPPIGKTP